MKAIAITLQLFLVTITAVGFSSCEKENENYPAIEPNVYLTNRPAAGAATFVKAVSVGEATSPGVARVYVDKLSSTDVTATVTFTGTATAGTDYTLPSLTVTIPANQYYAEILFPIIDDTVRETAETTIITLVSASGGYKPGLGTAGTNNIFTYTITDND